MARTKTENGREFPASAFLIATDPESPSTWSLRVEDADGKITSESLGRVAALFGKKQKKVALTAEEKTAALKKLAKLYESLPDVKLPPVLAEAITSDMAAPTFAKARKLFGKKSKATAKDGKEESVTEAEEAELLDDLATLEEAYLSQSYVPSSKDGAPSYEGRLAAVQLALRLKHEAIHRDVSPHSYDCGWTPVATYANSVVYETMGKTFEVSYSLSGSDAVIGDDHEEIALVPSRVIGEGREEDLFEYRPAGSFFLEASVGDDGVIRDTVLINATSANGVGGRVYSEKALRQIASMSEGLPAYANHVKDKADAFKPRDVKEIIGRHKNIRFDAAKKRVLSDLHVLESHRDWVMPLARDLGDVIGNSMVSRAVLRNDGKQEIVEEVLAVRSGDLVSDPATTRGLFEHREHGGRPPASPGGEDMNATEILKHLEANPLDKKVLTEALVAPIVAEKDAAHAKVVAEKDAKIGTLTEDLGKRDAKIAEQAATLTEQGAKLDGYKAGEATAAKRGRLTKVLTESDLAKKHGKNAEAASEKFVGFLMEADETKWAEMIDDRVKTLDQAVAQAAPRPRSFVKDSETVTESRNGTPSGDVHEKVRAALTRF